MSARATAVAYLGWMASLGVLYFTLAPAQVVIATAMILCAAGVIVFGVRRHRPDRERGWLTLAAALVLGAGVRALSELLSDRAGAINPGRYLVHVLYVLMFAFLVAGLLALARRPRAGGTTRPSLTPLW